MISIPRSRGSGYIARSAPKPPSVVADPPTPVVRIQVRVPANVAPGKDIPYKLIVTNTSAANAYRECLNGDGEPRWTEVWSHIQLGKIFDVTGQRERATNEYRQALQTNDNTQGALDEARRYLQKAFEQKKTSNG